MGINKVKIGNETLIDLTNDTVKENNLLKGTTAHGADGETVYGGVVTAPLTTSLAVTQSGVSALDGMVGKALNDKGLQMSVYKGEDGNLHFRDWTGADTVIPFNMKGNYDIKIPITSRLHGYGGTSSQKILKSNSLNITIKIRDGNFWNLSSNLIQTPEYTGGYYASTFIETPVISEV